MKYGNFYAGENLLLIIFYADKKLSITDFRQRKSSHNSPNEGVFFILIPKSLSNLIVSHKSLSVGICFAVLCDKYKLFFLILLILPMFVIVFIVSTQSVTGILILLVSLPVFVVFMPSATPCITILINIIYVRFKA